MKNFKKLSVILMAVSIMILAVSCNLISGQPNEVEHLHELTEVAEVAATCTADGTKAYYTCSGCDKLFADAEGATEITAPEAIEKLAHTEEIVPGKAATCTEKGLTEGKICSVCETVLVAQDEIALADHTEKVVPGKAATCTEKGLTDGKICSVCEAVLVAQEEIPMAAHTEEVVSGKAATCTEKGLTDGKKCSVCKAILVAQEEIPMAAHTEEVIPGKAATCTETGLTDGKKCSVCKAVIVAQEEIPMAAHTEEVIPGKAATCTETGLTDGKKCSVCKAILVEQAVIAVKDHKDDNGDLKCDVCQADLCTSHTPAEAVDENVKAATCTEAGSYDRVVRCSVCNATISKDTITVNALGHDFSGEVIESEGNYYKECQNGCGETQAVEPPVTSYDAVLDNAFVSDKTNVLNLAFTNRGAWGIVTNGSHKLEDGTPETGALGGLDAKGKYVYYEFVMEEAGTVDFIWNIAGSLYNSSTKGNDGIADMANYMTITIDGVPVNIGGIALPAGGTYPWWNLQNVVVKGVKLDAGVHTFKCDILGTGGLNVNTMTIQSTVNTSVRSAEFTSADIVAEGDKVYYVFTYTGSSYSIDELAFWHNSTTSYPIASLETVGDVTTIKIDVTDIAVNGAVDPHVSFAGVKYINGANVNGDILGFAFEEKVVNANGKCYMLVTNWNMPSILVAGDNYMKIQGADIYEEDGKLYYTLSYRIANYDPSKFEFFDGTTIYAFESYEMNGLTVTFKFNLSDKAAGFNLWPHLRVNGTNWDGAANVADSKGDVKVSVTTETITFNGKTYTLKAQYSMPTVVVASAG